MLLQFGSLIADLPDGWIDCTEDVPAPDAPFTLAKEDGVGALQFTTARYLSGKVPHAMRTDLGEWLEERAILDGWGDPIRFETGTNSMMFASGEYRHGPDFMKAWYLSDGRNFAFATYVCEWGERDRELGEVNAIVGTLRFSEDGPETDD